MVWLKGGGYFWGYFLLFWVSGFFFFFFLVRLKCYFVLFWDRQPHQRLKRMCERETYPGGGGGGAVKVQYSKRLAQFRTLYPPSPVTLPIGLDRLSFIGLTPSSLSDWATAEALQGDLTIYLNRWTPQEIRLSRSDVAQLFRAAAASGEDVGQLATDFTCAALKSTAGEGVTESWNNLQDKREEYIQTRRQLLKERRDAAMRGVPKQLAAEEAKDLDALASTVTGDPLHTKEGSQRRDTLQLSEMTLGEISPEVKLALIGVLVQRPEVLRAYAGETGGVVSVAIQSKDFSLSCTKLRAMCNYCSLHGVGFPRLQFVQIGAEPQELEGMEKYGKKVYERPQNWMQLGRMEEADGLLV